MMVFCCLLIAYEEERLYWPERFLTSYQRVFPDQDGTCSDETEKNAPVIKMIRHDETVDCVLPDGLLKFIDRFFTIIIIVIFSIFNLMMIMTTLYFHTPIEKVLGVAMGVCGYNLISFKYPWNCFPQLQDCQVSRER